MRSSLGFFVFMNYLLTFPDYVVMMYPVRYNIDVRTKNKRERLRKRIRAYRCPQSERSLTMKTTERTPILSALKHMSKTKLESIRSTLSSWEKNHDKKKKSYLWLPPLSARERRSKEDYYTFVDEIKIGESTLQYYSDCTMSCKHVYWNDGLSIKDQDGISVTFRDVTIIRNAISEILHKRTEKEVA